MKDSSLTKCTQTGFDWANLKPLLFAQNSILFKWELKLPFYDENDGNNSQPM